VSICPEILCLFVQRHYVHFLYYFIYSVFTLLLTLSYFIYRLPLLTFHRKRRRELVEAEQVVFNATAVSADRDLELDAAINQAINVGESCPQDDVTSPIKRKRAKKSSKALMTFVPPSINELGSDSLVEDCAQGVTEKPPVHSRTSPFKLEELFNGLSEAQRAAFRQTPLGHLLDLQIGKLPLNFSHYIINNYNPSTQEIRLADGKHLSVTAKSIQLALGLPMGPRSMLKLPRNVTKSQITDMKNIWRSQFKGVKRTMKALKELIHNNKDDVGPAFLRNMFIYIISGVIWSGGLISSMILSYHTCKRLTRLIS